MAKLKIVQLFETYNAFYQPYIPEVVDSLKKNQNLIIQVDAYKGKPQDGVNIIPTYYRRKFKERVFKFTNKTMPKLNFVEIDYLKNKVNIVHVQHSYLHRKVKGLLLLPKSDRPKIVITLRGADSYMKPWIDESWFNFYKGYGQHVDAFITMSENQKLYMQKWGVAPNKIHVIPISYGNPFEVKTKTVDPNCIKIVSAFRMCWEKNIDGNLRTVRQLINKGFQVNYDIYGDGNDASQVPFLIDRYNLSNSVNYYGSISNELLKQKIINSDFYLQLSLSESLGMSIIEAQTYGLPAIVSDSDGLPEVVLHNKTGFCVKSFEIGKAADYIEHLWKNPKQYSEFSKAAITHSQGSFSVNMEVERLLKLYQSITL